MVPASFSGGTPCSSPATMKRARIGQHRAVHGHGDGHLFERDAVEQRAHVVDAVDGHAGHADVAFHAGMVAVVAAMRGEVEGDGEALLTGGDVAAVEGVRFLGGGEAGVLADGPGLGDVHRRVRAAHVGRDAGVRAEEVEGGGVRARVDWLDRDPFRRRPRFAGGQWG